MAFERLNIGLVFIGVVVAVATLGYTIYMNQEVKVVQEDSRFYCELQADSSRGGEVWTVMYRHEGGVKPWLRMVREMGEDWDTPKRCEAIAERLEIFRQDGLLTFDYRTDPNTPRQYVICAKTKLSGDNCPLVLTLKPEDNPYEALREVAGALLPGSLPSYQCDNPENCPPPEPVTISLDEQL